MTRVATAETIRIWADRMPDAHFWENIGPELERPRWENSRLVRNVSEPTLTVFLPEPSVAVGTGVVVCPGGAFHFLMVDKEGSEVAHWLNARGIAAFVLKYRLVPTPDDDEAFIQQVSNRSQRRAQMDHVRPASVADGLQAMRIIRQQASRWGVRRDRIGIMGFSAGAAVAAGVATQYDAETRPTFVAPIYGMWDGESVPADAPPLFLAAATDDELVDTQWSLKIYSAWKVLGRPAELHLYAQGGHGFALLRQGLPSDHWIDNFEAWLRAQKLVK